MTNDNLRFTIYDFPVPRPVSRIPNFVLCPGFSVPQAGDGHDQDPIIAPVSILSACNDHQKRCFAHFFFVNTVFHKGLIPFPSFCTYIIERNGTVTPYSAKIID